MHLYANGGRVATWMRVHAGYHGCDAWFCFVACGWVCHVCADEYYWLAEYAYWTLTWYENVVHAAEFYVDFQA